MTPEQKKQISLAISRALSMKDRGHSCDDVRYALREASFHVTPRRVALSVAFPCEETSRKLVDLVRATG